MPVLSWARTLASALLNESYNLFVWFPGTSRSIDLVHFPTPSPIFFPLALSLCRARFVVVDLALNIPSSVVNSPFFVTLLASSFDRRHVTKRRLLPTPTSRPRRPEAY